MNSGDRFTHLAVDGADNAPEYRCNRGTAPRLGSHTHISSDVMYDDHHIFRSDGDQNWTEENAWSGVQRRANPISPGVTCQTGGVHSATTWIESTRITTDVMS